MAQHLIPSNSPMQALHGCVVGGCPTLVSACAQCTGFPLGLSLGAFLTERLVALHGSKSPFFAHF